MTDKHEAPLGLTFITLPEIDTDFFKVGDVYVLKKETEYVTPEIICGVCSDISISHTDTRVNYVVTIDYYRKDEWNKPQQCQINITPDQIQDKDIIILDRINASKYKK